MADPHQVNAIIAAAICECRKDASEIKTEEAKQMAKHIVEALLDAGLRISPATGK